MEGRIYISSAFTNLRGVECKPNRDWLDNDPHLYNSPPTWGICRTDYRRVLKEDDYIFFVLPKHTTLPQMVYGYFKIRDHIDHITAYRRFPQKRMRNGNPNGNIIVDADGNYNRFDNGIHKDQFSRIKEHYIVGDPKDSWFLKPKDVQRLAPSFLKTLNKIFNSNADDIYHAIWRSGRVLDEVQVEQLLKWLNK